MDKYRVDLAELLAFVDRLQSFDSRAEETASAVDDLVGQLHGQWLGQAADAHRARHDEWMAETAAMRQAVMELHRTASRAHTNYRRGHLGQRRDLALVGTGKRSDR